MKKLKVFTVVTAMVLIVSSVFNACQKEEVIVSNLSTKVIKSLSYDDILTNSISIEDFPLQLRFLGENYVNEGGIGYLVFAHRRENIKYGYITEDYNGGIYDYLPNHFEEIIYIGTYGEDWMDFDDIEEALDWIRIVLINGRDMTIYKNEHNKWTVILEELYSVSGTITNDYPFVLDINMEPYQYAVSKADFSLAFEHMQTIFDSYQEWMEWGYFMLSLSDDHTLIYYGFISESSSYYDPTILDNNSDYPFIFISDPNNPSIVVDNDDDDDESMTMCALRKFKTVSMAKDWVYKQREKGYTAGMLGSNKNGKIVCYKYK